MRLKVRRVKNQTSLKSSLGPEPMPQCVHRHSDHVVPIRTIWINIQRCKSTSSCFERLLLRKHGARKSNTSFDQLRVYINDATEKLFCVKEMICPQRKL